MFFWLFGSAFLLSPMADLAVPLAVAAWSEPFYRGQTMVLHPQLWILYLTFGCPLPHLCRCFLSLQPPWLPFPLSSSFCFLFQFRAPLASGGFRLQAQPDGGLWMIKGLKRGWGSQRSQERAWPRMSDRCNRVMDARDKSQTLTTNAAEEHRLYRLQLTEPSPNQELVDVYTNIYICIYIYVHVFIEVASKTFLGCQRVPPTQKDKHVLNKLAIQVPTPFWSRSTTMLRPTGVIS